MSAKSKIKKLGMVAFFIGLAGLVYGDDLYGCLTVNQPPVIDGEANDVCWQDAVWGTAFTTLGTTNPAPDQTRFALCADKSNLYFFAFCSDRNAENIKALHKTGDGSVWQDECVELFIDPGTDGKKTAHLTFNALGACDLMWNDENESFPENMIKAAAKRTTAGWQVEAVIPFKDIGAVTPQANDRWSVNLGREHRHIGEAKVKCSSWVYIPKGGFFTPSRFCGMRLADKSMIKSRQMAAPVKPDESLANKKVMIENPSFSPDQNGKLKAWEQAGHAQWGEETALSGKYIITLSAEGDGVCQKAGPVPISGAEYEMAVMAKGAGSARVEARLIWLSKEGGQKETSYVVSNLTDKTETFTFKDKFPLEADKMSQLSLHWVGKQGEVTLYSAFFKLAGQASDFIINVSEGKPDILAPEVWPVGKPAATPHIKWADPCAGKKLHAAIILEMMEREAVELAQRLEMDYDIIHAPGDKNCYAFNADRVMSNFCGRGRNYDVIVVAADDIASDEFADRILACVEQGAGLLYVTPYPSRNINEWHPKPLSPAALRLQKILPAVKPLNEMREHYVLKNLPLTGTSTNKDERTGIEGIGLGNYGKGKIVRLEYAGDGTRGLMAPTLVSTKWDSKKEDNAWWEYGWALLARSMAWVAGYEPAAWIENMAVKDNTVEVKFKYNVLAGVGNSGSASTRPTTEAPNSTYKNAKTVAGGGAPGSVSAEIIWTSKNAELTEPLAKEQPNGLKCLAYSKEGLKPDQTSLSIPIPKSISRYGGLHFCNIILRDEKGRAVDYGALPLKIESPVKITVIPQGPKTEYYNSYKIGDTVTVKVDVIAGKQDNFCMKSFLVDAFDRTGWQESKTIALQPGNNSMVLSMPVSRTLLSNLTRLTVVLQDEEGLTMAGENAVIYVHGTDRARRNDFLLGAYTCSEFLIGEYRSCLDVLMDEVGADLITRRLSPYGRLSLKLYVGGDSGIWQGAAPVTSSNETRYANNIRKNCFNNPSNISEAVKIALRQADRVSFVDGIGITMADEVTICSHRDPRDYCYCAICREGFKEYARNVYGTIEQANREWGTAFSDWSAVQPSTLEEIQKNETARGKTANYSIWVDYKLYIEQSFLNVYKAVRDALVAKHPEMAVNGATPLGFGNPVWHGPLMGENYYTWAKEEYFLLKYFNMVNILAYKSFNRQGHCAIWFGYSSNIPTVIWQPWWFAFNKGDSMIWWPDFGNYPVRRGYGHLALFSLQGSHTPRSLALKESCYDLLHGVGQIIRGSDTVKRQVAFLHSQPSYYTAYAVGRDSSYRAAVFKFRNLVRDAGYEFDFVQDEERKTKLENYRLLVLPCTLAMSAETQKAIVEFAERGGTVLADVAPGQWDEHGKPFEGGGLLENLLQQAAAQNPASDSKMHFTLAPCGKGKLICLNKKPGLKQHREVIRDLLDKTSLDKMAALTTKGNYETYGFQKGMCRYMGIIGIGDVESVTSAIANTNMQKEADAMTIQLKDKAHLYDVRARKYLGYTDTITVEAYREKGQFYAIMPYQITGLEAKCGFDEKAKEFWFEARLAVKGGAVEDQVLRVDVTDPDGLPARWYSGNFWTKGGKLEMHVPFALNDKPGNWKIKVTDVVSGEAAEKTFVKAMNP